jgi:hypothetical protein
MGPLFLNLKRARGCPRKRKLNVRIVLSQLASGRASILTTRRSNLGPGNSNCRGLLLLNPSPNLFVTDVSLAK